MSNLSWIDFQVNFGSSRIIGIILATRTLHDYNQYNVSLNHSNSYHWALANGLEIIRHNTYAKKSTFSTQIPKKA